MLAGSISRLLLLSVDLLPVHTEPVPSPNRRRGFPSHLLASVRRIATPCQKSQQMLRARAMELGRDQACVVNLHVHPSPPCLPRSRKHENKPSTARETTCAPPQNGDFFTCHIYMYTMSCHITPAFLELLLHSPSLRVELIVGHAPFSALGIHIHTSIYLTSVHQ